MTQLVMKLNNDEIEHIIQELQEPNKRLAEDSNRQPAEKELDDDFDPEK